ncbi:hypothetical protein ACLK10_13585 [Escherichia coli]
MQEIIELALVAAVPRQTKVNRESSLQTLVECMVPVLDPDKEESTMEALKGNHQILAWLH